MPDIGSPFPAAYPPAVAGDLVVQQIFSLPHHECAAEMARLDAARRNATLSAKTAYALFVVGNLIQRRLDGVSEVEIRRLAEGWAEIFAHQSTPRETA